jgi:hypothetical protein
VSRNLRKPFYSRSRRDHPWVSVRRHSPIVIMPFDQRASRYRCPRAPRHLLRSEPTVDCSG